MYINLAYKKLESFEKLTKFVGKQNKIEIRDLFIYQRMSRRYHNIETKFLFSMLLTLKKLK